MRGSILFLACLLIVFPCQAGTITVDNNGVADFDNIQAAIDSSNDGDVIIVSPGIYTGSGNRDIDFLGKAITVRSTHPNDPNVVEATIIDCQGTETEPHRGLYFHSGEDANSVLDGLTITNGYAPVDTSGWDPSPLGYPGGGIYCEESTPFGPRPGPTVRNCVIANNTTSGQGGGIYGCSGAITNCVIKGNSAFEGAGICSCDGQIFGCTISDNSAYGDGGGICCSGCCANIRNCMIVNNSAWIHGGGVYCSGPSCTIRNCTIVKNTTCPPFWPPVGWSSYGGGICCSSSSEVRIIGCRISDNSAEGGRALMDLSGGCAYGAGIYLRSDVAEVLDCVVTDNLAEGGEGGFGGSGGAGGDGGNAYGGGIYCDTDNRARIINCTISNNVVKRGVYGTGNPNGEYGRGWGGGVFLSEGGVWSNPSIINCTVTGNRLALGMGVCGGVYGNGTIINSIIWGNDGAEIEGSAGVNYSDVQGGWAGAGNINVNPLFSDSSTGDYHLVPDSPCIDAGSNSSIPEDIADLDGDGNTTEPIPFDLDGNPRVADGDIDGNSVVDMGAYEFFWPPIEVAMRFTPQALNPGSQGKWVKAHFVLPEGYVVEDVDTNSPAKIAEPFEPDIGSDRIGVFVNDDGLVEIEAAFDRAGFCAAGIEGNSVEVTGLGRLSSGRQFYGTDTIKIIDHHFECLAVFASHWLEAVCDKPDWCGGSDLNEDSVVDFLDLALFDACCIEISAE